MLLRQALPGTARHAEGVFIATSKRVAEKTVVDIRERAARLGRSPDDLEFFLGISPIVGGTEAEAKAFLAKEGVPVRLPAISGGAPDLRVAGVLRDLDHVIAAAHAEHLEPDLERERARPPKVRRSQGVR